MPPRRQCNYCGGFPSPSTLAEHLIQCHAQAIDAIQNLVDHNNTIITQLRMENEILKIELLAIRRGNKISERGVRSTIKEAVSDAVGKVMVDGIRINITAS